MVPHVAGKGRSFKGAALYYLHDKRTPEQREAGEVLLTTERVVFTATRNIPDDDPEFAWQLMAETALHADELKARAGARTTGRKATDPVYAYSLAWHPSQAPGQAEMIAAADESLKVLGYERHQAFFVAHDDEPHAHIHVIVNRVNPLTGKTHNPGNDFLRLSKWAEAFEREGGQIYCEERVLNNERRRAGERVKDEISLSRGEWEKQAAEEARAIRPADLVSAVARHHAHFTVEDLKREAENRTAAKPDEIVRDALDDPRLVKLFDADGDHVGYTTKATRQQETDTLARAQRMAGTMRHRVSRSAIEAAMESRTLDGEQQAAMIAALGPGGMKVIEGQAGTGKSYTMEAIAEAVRRDGYHVKALAKTVSVAADMEKTGAYSDARSINSLLWQVAKRPDDVAARVDSKTILMIDEAAMVETRLLDQVTRLAEERGAKVIMVGHDRQLSAVEYGGLFTDIARETGSVKLTQVRRQEEDWARQASADMAEGRFDKALKAFDAHGQIDWKDQLEDSCRASTFLTGTDNLSGRFAGCC